MAYSASEKTQAAVQYNPKVNRVNKVYKHHVCAYSSASPLLNTMWSCFGIATADDQCADTQARKVPREYASFVPEKEWMEMIRMMYGSFLGKNCSLMTSYISTQGAPDSNN